MPKTFLSLLFLLFYALGAPAQNSFDVASKKPPQSLIDPELAIKQFQIPAGFKMDLFAAEPQLLNPVQFCFDEQGRVFVAETFRYRKEVYDVRGHTNMYADDIACRTVEDRAAMMKKFLGARVNVLTNDSERIQLLEDRDGDGKADHSTVFADGFNSILDGVGAGVLASKGKVYFTDIPNLWMLQDTNHDGHADVRESIGYGFGVHMSLIGHDLHGLCMGPDGKIYFSSGDRGFNVRTREGKVLNYENTGGVLRCNPDGSDLEVFAYGLRNPQKLAFDDYGNLFTGDNNCDYGDAARLAYIVEDGDSGWRMGYQQSETTPAGIWNAEKLWHLPFPGQAADIVPPAAHIAQGPAGFTHYPGTGFPTSLNDHFFLCDYKGASPNSGIHSFAVKPNGAGFTMIDHTNFLWRILATDVNFSPDGRMFVADWVAHWPVTDKGRLYRFYNTNLVNSPLVLETKKLIGEGMAQRPVEKLANLLGHPDQRVRLAAQFELADRATTNHSAANHYIDALETVALHGTNQLSRIHALWGLGQIGARHAGPKNFLAPMLPMLTDADPEIRAQTAKILGDAHATYTVDALIQSLTDANLRVRFFAAQSLGKLRDKKAVAPLLAMLAKNNNHDPYLRHAGVMGLVGAADKKSLIRAALDRSPSARMGAMLAMRRLKLPEISSFLKDSDPQIVLETARAVNDAAITNAMPALAALIAEPSKNEALDWRVINANFRLGGENNATALARYAAHPDAPDRIRVEALYALQTWAQPSQRDRVTGQYNPLPPRHQKFATAALDSQFMDILKSRSVKVQIAAIRAAKELMLTNTGQKLFEIVASLTNAPGVRSEAIRALETFNDLHLTEAARLAVLDKDAAMRREGTRIQVKIDPAAAVETLSRVLDQGTISEKQGAFAILRDLKGEAAENLLVHWLDKLAAHTVQKEIQFDLLEAATRHNSPAIKERVEKHLDAQPDSDEFKGWRETLFGGNAANGHKIFTQRAEAGCVTCHRVSGKGGDVGPDLAGIITRHDREYILESILYPNKQIAPGFESLVVKTKDNQIYVGILKHESADELTINYSDDGMPAVAKVKTTDIKSRERGLSAMPEGLGKVLSKEDIRDLVQYLATTKAEK